MKSLLQQINEMPSDAQSQTIKDTKWKYPDQVANWLNENDFAIIGDGHYSQAWARKHFQKVVKFSTKEDLCYLKFAKFARKNSRNKYYPDIFAINQYKEDTAQDIMFVTIIERLQPLTRANIIKLNDPVAVAWLVEKGGIELKNNRRDIPVYKAMGIDTDELDWSQPYQVWDQVYDQHKELFDKAAKHPLRLAHRKAIDALGNSCYEDMHDGNIYYRGSTNSPVLMDPFS